MTKEFNLSKKMTLEHYEQPMYFQTDVQEFIKKSKKEFKIVEESADFDSYDLKAEKKSEQWISGFRRAMLLVNNCIDIYKFHRDKLAGEDLIETKKLLNQSKTESIKHGTCKCGHGKSMHGEKLGDCYFPKCTCKKYEVQK